MRQSLFAIIIAGAAFALGAGAAQAAGAPSTAAVSLAQPAVAVGVGADLRGQLVLAHCGRYCRRWRRAHRHRAWRAFRHNYYHRFGHFPSYRRFLRTYHAPHWHGRHHHH